jgi:ThiF family
MSQRLIARSADLKRLQDEGYDVRTRGAVVLVRDVPYLTAAKEIQRGTLVSTLVVDDDVTISPVQDHVAYFAGEKPHNASGSPIGYVIGENLQQTYGGVQVNIQMSAKPQTADRKYRDYHHKMATYIRILSGPVKSIDPEVTARTYPVIVEDEEETVFNYVDSASSRAGLDVVTDKLKVRSVAVIGLGGTGSYILDLLAKTPIGKIHLYDGDTFHQHNAFRAPGAPTNEDLAQRLKKVRRLGEIYSAMRREIIEHDFNVDELNIDELREMDFVFIAIDNGKARKLIAEKLEEFGVAFVDAGLGIKEKNGALVGMVRTSTSRPDYRARGRKLPFSGGDDEDDYTRNIQIADLNALNGILAVMRWKRLVGFYGDIAHEHQSLYAINSNYLINDDTAP